MVDTWQPLASLLKNVSGSEANDAVLAAVADKGWVLQSARKQELFLTASQLQAGEITEHEFYEVAKIFCTLASMPPGFGAFCSYNETVADIEAKIKDKAVTNLISSRYLSGLETARGLAPESIRIATVVKEVVEDGFDDHEVTYLQADSMVARDFLREDIAPFMEFLEKGASETFPLEVLRRKRAELKMKLEIQKKNVQVHMQRSHKGIALLKEGDLYHIYSNHLPRHAAACALESLLRAYYALLGSFDPEDVMVANDWQNLIKLTEDRAQSIVDLYNQYVQGRRGLLTTRFERDGKKISFWVHDAGAIQDHLAPTVSLQVLAGKNICSGQMHENGALEYSCNSYLSRKDIATVAGMKAYEAALKSMNFEGEATVWNTQFEPHVKNMAKIIEVALQQRSDILQQVTQHTTLGQPARPEATKMAIPQCISYAKYLEEKERWLLTMPLGEVHWRDHTTQLPFAICKVAGGTYPGDLQDTDCNIATDGVTYVVDGDVSPESISILVDITGFHWTQAENGSIPEEAVAMGETWDKKRIYTARGDMSHGSGLFRTWGNCPGSIREGMQGYQYESKGSAKIGRRYEVLCYGAPPAATAAADKDETSISVTEEPSSAALQAQIVALQLQLASLKRE